MERMTFAAVLAFVTDHSFDSQKPATGTEGEWASTQYFKMNVDELPAGGVRSQAAGAGRAGRERGEDVVSRCSCAADS